MDRTFAIRKAQRADAVEISHLVKTTLRTSNAGDYSMAWVERVVGAVSVEAVEGMLERREVLVAFGPAGIVGTASLEGDVVRTVFVLPEEQGKGIGQRLMAGVEAIARARGLGALRVPASLTARAFYGRLGYVAVEEVLYGDERTILMEKALG